MSDQVPTSVRQTRLLGLISLRVVVVTLLLGVGTVVHIRARSAWPVDPFFSLLGVTYALSVFYALTLRFVERHRWLVDLQLCLDTLIITALVLITGGVTSLLSTLYALSIVAASTLQGRRGGILVGVLSSVLYGGMILIQYTGTLTLLDVAWLPRPSLPPLEVGLYTLGSGLFGFMAVAVLSGYLAERATRADARFERASHEIADLQTFNQHVIESLTIGLITTNARGEVLTLNRSAERIMGSPASRAVGRPLYTLLSLSAEHERRLRDAEGGAVDVEVEHRPASGDSIDLRVRATILQAPRQASRLWTIEDVTEARRHERQWLAKQRLAAVGEMAAGIAHEIRNPLASMSGSIQILRQDVPLTTEQERLMDIVLRESARLNETIRSFLDYARPRRSATSRLDLRRVVSDTALLLRHGTDLGDAVTVDVDVPSKPVWYEADENHIRQILWNLSANARQAMPEGGCLRVTLHDAVDGSVTVSVADEGRGIPAGELQDVMQPFHGRFGQGTGLGLAIVHRIVSDYGGDVEIASIEHVGTTVTIHLPAQPPADRPVERRVAAVS